jgi:hypothetical protein
MIWAKSWQTPRRSANDMGGVVDAVVAPISYTKSALIRRIRSTAASRTGRPGEKLSAA